MGTQEFGQFKNSFEEKIKGTIEDNSLGEGLGQT